MNRAAFAVLAAASILAASPVAAQTAFLVPAQPREGFERCIVDAWTQATAPKTIRWMEFRGQVRPQTLAGGVGELVVAADFYNDSGEVEFRARTTVAGGDAVTVITGQERMRYNLFGRPHQITLGPTGLDRDIDVPPHGGEYLERAIGQVLALYQPAARACRTAHASS